MGTLIQQSVVLPASAESLYETYINPERHAELAGAPVVISTESGSPFSAFEGALSGTTMVAIPSRLIVQKWRSTNFRDSDPDSTLILTFVSEGKHGRIDLVHLDVPEVDYEGVTQGWKTYYWEPWRKLLSAPV